MCVLQGEAALKFAANALGVPAADLTSALCTKLLHVGGNTVVQQQSVEQSEVLTPGDIDAVMDAIRLDYSERAYIVTGAHDPLLTVEYN